MKNVLFIGPYRQNCSWGMAARAYIRALKAAGYNLTLRPIYMGIPTPVLDPFFIELEQNKFDKYDAVIQNVLPHLLDYNSKFGKNIALCYTETSNWQNTWPRKLNTMDEIWVPSTADQKNMKDSNVYTPCRIMPIPVDPNKYCQEYQKIDGIEEDYFNFYFIGEFIERKNIELLVQAFHTEFDRNEKVNLVIKTNRQGMSSQDLANAVNVLCDGIKKTLRIYKNPEDYKQEIVITEYLPDEAINSLHQSCHCFVMPSSGESWSMPVLDAIGFGNIPVVTNGIGSVDMLPEEGKEHFIVKSAKEAVIVKSPPLTDLYTGQEYWYRPNIKSLRERMRWAFDNKDVDISERVYEFTEAKIAERMMGCI
jgi:glycosyltransferase involved in cell wall biosynthesis